MGAELLVARPHAERALRQVDLGHRLVEQLDVEPGGLLLHPLHQLGAEDAARGTRVVLDLGGQHELAAGVDALEHHGVQVGPAGVQGRGVAGRPRADHDHAAGQSMVREHPPTRWIARASSDMPPWTIDRRSQPGRRQRKDRATLTAATQIRGGWRVAQPLALQHVAQIGGRAVEPRADDANQVARMTGEGRSQTVLARPVAAGPAMRSASCAGAGNEVSASLCLVGRSAAVSLPANATASRCNEDLVEIRARDLEAQGALRRRGDGPAGVRRSAPPPPSPMRGTTSATSATTAAAASADTTLGHGRVDRGLAARSAATRSGKKLAAMSGPVPSGRARTAARPSDAASTSARH